MAESWISIVPNRWGGNRYAIHQDLWRAFPLQHGENQPFVYRVETDRVLVRSIAEPYWDGGHACTTCAREENVADQVRISVHMNVHHRCAGKDIPVQESDVEPFVRRKIAEAGLRVVSNLAIQPFRVQLGRGSNVPLFPVRVDATVDVLDRRQFVHALTNGVGRAKYLGFGMIVIER